MPIYYWKCRKCGKLLELIMTLKEMELIKSGEIIQYGTICCGKLMEIDVPAQGIYFALKGRGWASDGYCGAWELDQIEHEMKKNREYYTPPEQQKGS